VAAASAMAAQDVHQETASHQLSAVIFYCGNLPLIQHLSLIIEKS